MTPEEKELLFKDLSARLPYGVIIQHSDLFKPSVSVTEKLEEYYKGHFGSDGVDVEFVKPYLRSMSSMTEEEKIESLNFAWKDDYGRLACYDENISKYIDWLNAHHFDYRGLIKKGLALVAPEGMYN